MRGGGVFGQLRGIVMFVAGNFDSILPVYKKFSIFPAVVMLLFIEETAIRNRTVITRMRIYL